MLPSLDYFENYIPTLHKTGEAIDERIILGEIL